MVLGGLVPFGQMGDQPCQQGIFTASLQPHSPRAGKLAYQCLSAQQRGLQAAHSGDLVRYSFLKGYHVSIIYRIRVRWPQLHLMYGPLAGEEHITGAFEPEFLPRSLESKRLRCPGFRPLLDSVIFSLTLPGSADLITPEPTGSGDRFSPSYGLFCNSSASSLTVKSERSPS